MGELDEVAGVDPAPFEVDRATEPFERIAEDDIAVGVLVPRPRVDGEAPIVEMRRPAVQLAWDDVRSVALSLEEGDDLAQPRAEQGSARRNTKRW